MTEELRILEERRERLPSGLWKYSPAYYEEAICEPERKTFWQWVRSWLW